MIVDVLIPVLDRPERVGPVISSLRRSAVTHDVSVRETFLCNIGDQRELGEIAMCKFRAVTIGAREPGDYARKINLGAQLSSAEWFFLGADDLHFHPGWLDACLRLHEATGALVIGTNDLGNPLVKIGRHATHSLVHRSYLEQGTIDEPGKLLHEGYDHNCVDVEFTETAIWRQTWAFCADARVEHLHWLWKKGVQDTTYELGQQRYTEDRRLLQQRMKLWHHDEVMRTLRRSRRQVQGPGVYRREIRLR